MNMKALYAVSRSVGRNEGLVSITAVIDPSMWSQRKKNIIIRAIEQGVATCGRETARFVNDLMEHHTGQNLPTVSHWYCSMESHHIRPEKFDDLMAYTTAWVRLKKAKLPEKDHNRPYYSPRLPYSEQNFLRDVEEGKTPQSIPLNTTMTHKERGEFIQEYVIQPDEDAMAVRRELVEDIKNNVPISFTFNNR